MGDLTQWIVSSGFLAAISISGVTVWRQRRLEIQDVGSSAVAYIAGSNIPAAAFLCWYGLYPDPPTVLTKLHGYEKYVAFAGFCLMLLSLVSLWGLVKKAYDRVGR
jgi:hypothetical protein